MNERIRKVFDQSLLIGGIICWRRSAPNRGFTDFSFLLVSSHKYLSSSSSCHQTSVFHLSMHFFAVSLNLLRSSNEQGCARRVHCIMYAVFSVASRTHKSYLLRSTAISVFVPRYMGILCVVDSGISTSSMVCQILWLNFRLC